MRIQVQCQSVSTPGHWLLVSVRRFVFAELASGGRWRVGERERFGLNDEEAGLCSPELQTEEGGTYEGVTAHFQDSSPSSLPPEMNTVYWFLFVGCPEGRSEVGHGERNGKNLTMIDFSHCFPTGTHLPSFCFLKSPFRSWFFLVVHGPVLCTLELCS